MNKNHLKNCLVVEILIHLNKHLLQNKINIKKNILSLLLTITIMTTIINKGNKVIILLNKSNPKKFMKNINSKKNSMILNQILQKLTIDE